MTLAPTRAYLVQMNVDLTAEVVKLRVQVEALKDIKVRVVQDPHYRTECVYCGLRLESQSEAVEHAARCENHPAVKRLKSVAKPADALVELLVHYLMTGTPIDPEATRDAVKELAAAIDSGTPVPGVSTRQYPDPNRTVDDVLGFFSDAVERAVAHQQTPKGGMQVPFHGDFMGAPMSTLIRLQWWVREFRDAIARERKEPTP